MYCVEIFAKGVVEGDRRLLEEVESYLQSIGVESCEKGIFFLDDGVIYYECRATIPGKPLLRIAVRGKTLQDAVNKARMLLKTHLPTARLEMGTFLASKWDKEEELFDLLREVKGC